MCVCVCVAGGVPAHSAAQSCLPSSARWTQNAEKDFPVKVFHRQMDGQLEEIMPLATGTAGTGRA